jgi:hypothetical protein
MSESSGGRFALAYVRAFLILLLATGTAVARTDAYYAFVQVAQVDEHLQPIRNENGQKRVTNFCLMWTPGWPLNNRTILPLNDGPNVYQHYSYRVNSDDHVLTMYELYASVVTTTDNGTKIIPTGGTRYYSVNIKVQMYPQPNPQWPCSQNDWDADMVRAQIAPPAGGGVAQPCGDQHYPPEPSRRQIAGSSDKSPLQPSCAPPRHWLLKCQHRLGMYCLPP